MTLSHSTDNTFVGIDVGGAGLDVAWHRGDSAHYANRPDAIATLVERLRTGPEVTRIVLEPTGGYEKALVKALRQAQLPVEVRGPRLATSNCRKMRSERNFLNLQAAGTSSNT